MNEVASTLNSPANCSISQDIIDQVIEEYNYGREKENQIDETCITEDFIADENCVNVSIDDVGTVEQKETGRMKNSPPKEGKHYVKNTVIHIQKRTW